MNINLYNKELKRNRKSLLIWTSIVIVFTVLVMSMFPYMKHMGDQMAAMMSQLPQGMIKAMGINAQTFTSILGMYNTYYGIYIVVLLSIFCASTAATIISKEEKDRTADFLLTKPISRKNIYTTKVLTLFTLVFAAYSIQTTVAYLFVVLLGGENVDWSIFITMHTHGLMLILLFTCITLFLSMLMKPKKSFMGMTVAMVFGSFFLDTISKLDDSVNWIGYISPFHYLGFDVGRIGYKIHFPSIAVVLALCVILLIVSFKLYDKKDISA